MDFVSIWFMTASFWVFLVILFHVYALSSVKVRNHIGTCMCVRPFVCPFHSCYGFESECVISLFKITNRIYRIITPSGITPP